MWDSLPDCHPFHRTIQSEPRASRLGDLIENAMATISRWALAPVFGKATAANAVRLIKSTAWSATGGGTIANSVRWTVQDPFEDAGFNDPQPGAHALGSDKPSIHSISVSKTRGMHPGQIETSSREQIVNDATVHIG